MANPLSVALGIAQAGYGIAKEIKTNRAIKGLISQRKAFQTPDEIFQILNATQFNAQGDTASRDYATDQIDNSFSNSLNTAEILGADPNTLSNLFSQKMQGILQVGQQFHASNMEAFGKYLGALNTVAENKAAEQISKDNLIKDQLAAQGVNLTNSFQNISGGINTAISGLSAAEQMKLYKEQQDKLVNPLGTTLNSTFGNISDGANGGSTGGVLSGSGFSNGL